MNEVSPIVQAHEVIVFAFTGFSEDLVTELRLLNLNFDAVDDRAYAIRMAAVDFEVELGQSALTGMANRPFAWAQAVVLGQKLERFESVSEAAKIVHKLGRHRSSFSFCQHRRHELIRQQAPDRKLQRIDFAQPLPQLKWSFWTLLESRQIWVGQSQSESPVMGVVEFIEDKVAPPSRAYLKLWEVFSLYCPKPKAKSRVIDMGAAPGGWSWVLRQLGCDVIAVDKGKMELAADPKLEILQQDVYKLNPHDFDVEWLFCDMITEPVRLLEMATVWLSAKSQLKMVCTIKYKGRSDFDILRKFRELSPTSQFVHLYHNKHEITWLVNMDSI